MGLKITNGNTQVKYINIWVGKIHLSFTYFEALKAFWKTLIAVIIVIKWLIPAYYKAETMYDNVQQVPAIVQTVDSTKKEFTNFRFTVESKWKWQDSVYKNKLIK